MKASEVYFKFTRADGISTMLDVYAVLSGHAATMGLQDDGVYDRLGAPLSITDAAADDKREVELADARVELQALEKKAATLDKERGEFLEVAETAVKDLKAVAKERDELKAQVDKYLTAEQQSQDKQEDPAPAEAETKTTKKKAAAKTE